MHAPAARPTLALCALLGVLASTYAEAAPIDYVAAPGSEPAATANLSLRLDALDASGAVVDTTGSIAFSAPLQNWSITLDSDTPTNPGAPTVVALGVEIGATAPASFLTAGSLSVEIAVNALSFQTRGAPGGDPFLALGGEQSFFDNGSGLLPSISLTINGTLVEIFGDTAMAAAATLLPDDTLLLSRLSVRHQDTGPVEFTDSTGQRWRLPAFGSVGGGGFQDEAIAFAPESAIPEPTSAILFCAGLALLLRRR